VVLQVTPAVKAEMGQILKDNQGKKVVTATPRTRAFASSTRIGEGTYYHIRADQFS